MREGDARAVQRALREADLIWRSGTELGRAVLWVERAASFAQAVGDTDRASELAAYAVDLGREVERRSGMPDRSDPAWEEARRIQSSLIEVRDSWLDPVEVEAADTVRPPEISLLDVDIEVIDDSWTIEVEPVTDVRRTLPDLGTSERARVLTSQDTWFDEAPTLPRTILPLSERDTIRPPLSSLNELTLLVELEGATGPDVLVQRPVSAGVSKDSLDAIRARLQSCPELKDTPEAKLEKLLKAGSLLQLNDRAALVGWDAGVVLEGELGMLRRGVVSHRIETGASFSCTGTIPGTIAHIAAMRRETRLIAWERAKLESILEPCPWVLEGLKSRADHLLTLGAIGLGNVARHMGEPFAQSLLEASRVVVLPPGTVLFEGGTEVHALNIVGGGSIELVDSAGKVRHAAGGRMLFPRELVRGSSAPMTARAGRSGATVLHVQAIELPRFLPHVPLLTRALSELD